MTPEEKVKAEIWEVLQDLKEKSLLPDDDGAFFYDTTHTVIAAGEINLTLEEKWAVVKKLARDGVIEIVRAIEPDWRGGRNGFYLKVIQPTFEEIYEKYRIINDSQEGTQAVPSHAYSLTNSELVGSLEFKFNSFKDLPEKGFFLGIADYIKFIDENPGFEEIISAIDAFKEKDAAILVELGKKLLLDVERVEKVIKDRLQGVEISSKIVEKSLEELEMRKDGRIQSSVSKTEELYSGLGYVITTLYENGYENLVSDLIKFIPNTKSIADYKISEYYYPYKEELTDYKTKIQKTIWGSWNELIVVYLVVHKYKEKKKELIAAKDALGEMNLYGLHEEMESILGNSYDKEGRMQFIKDDYIIHINRVHDFVINKLNSDPNRNTGDEGGRTLQERYTNLLEEVRTNTIDLQDRYNKLLAEIKSQRSEKSKAIPQEPHNEVQSNSADLNLLGWSLIKDVKKPQLRKNDKVVYEFATNWSDKYRFFECLWENQGHEKSSQELFEYKSSEKYPEKGKRWKINKYIGEELTKLLKEPEFKNHPIRIDRNNGYTLFIDEVAPN
ncbi:hypothetical protein HYS95_00095 [Candidatus Daviesbacteria bacterium]|nr:hypothetical protein [Candidatus Daviesbacteria bacterium]